MTWIMGFDQFRCKPGTNHQEEQQSAQQKKEASKGRSNYQKDEDRRKPEALQSLKAAREARPSH
jgi:hypothetical protein